MHRILFTTPVSVMATSVQDGAQSSLSKHRRSYKAWNIAPVPRPHICYFFYNSARPLLSWDKRFDSFRLEPVRAAYPLRNQSKSSRFKTACSGGEWAHSSLDLPRCGPIRFHALAPRPLALRFHRFTPCMGVAD